MMLKTFVELQEVATLRTQLQATAIQLEAAEENLRVTNERLRESEREGSERVRVCQEAEKRMGEDMQLLRMEVGEDLFVFI